MTFPDILTLAGIASFAIATICALRARLPRRGGWGIPTALWSLASGIFFLGGKL